jgi:acetyltransferase-like isoleucine patch superfamily enzyme
MIKRGIYYFIRKTREWYWNRKITQGKGRIRLIHPFVKFKIYRHPTGKIILNGDLFIGRHLFGNSCSRIIVGNNGVFQLNGPFTIGNGVCLHVSREAQLVIGGSKLEKKAGITADTLIMTYKSIMIGTDFVCSWNVFISDCDWHNYNNQPPQGDVKIGNHVWVGNNCNILKGTIIADDCVVASMSKVGSNYHETNSLIGGNPAKVIKHGIAWDQEIKTN